MFTGIIEHLGTIKSLDLRPDGGRVKIHAPGIVGALAVSNSIAVNGCCLTIVSIEKGHFKADLSAETIRATAFGSQNSPLKPGVTVNLEVPLTAGKEFGGHFVLGHVDAAVRVTHLTSEGENWWLGAEIPEELACYVVPKGSITVDGISLTVARWQDRIAEVAVIPYTYAHTNLRDRKPGDAVNLEVDVLGKYVERHLQARSAAAKSGSSVTLARLVEEGF